MLPRIDEKEQVQGVPAVVDSGAITLTGTGAQTIAALVIVQMSATISGTGAQTIAALVVVIGSAAISGTGSQTIAALVVVVGISAQSGLGSQTTVALVVIQGSAVMSGTGSQTIVALVLVQAGAIISGTGSEIISATLLVQGTAAVSGTGTQVSSGLVVVIGSSLLTGLGAQTAGALLLVFGAGVLSAEYSGLLAGIDVVEQPRGGPGQSRKLRKPHMYRIFPPGIPWDQWPVRYEGAVRLIATGSLECSGIVIKQATIKLRCKNEMACRALLYVVQTSLRFSAQFRSRQAGQVVHLWLNEDPWLLQITDMLETEEEINI